MLAKQLLSQIFEDDALTRGLGDPEARLLVEWLVERVEEIAGSGVGATGGQSQVARLRRRGRSISRFVALWCHAGERGAAGQLATAERLYWPLPGGPVDPCELMLSILGWEEQQLAEFGPSRLASTDSTALRSAA